MGLRLNMQRALERVSGTVVVLADQDDLWAADKLDAIERAFVDPNVTLWFSDAELVDERDQPFGRRAWQAINFAAEAQDRVRRGGGLEPLLYGQLVTGATMAVRADITRLALPLPPELEGAGHLFLHDGWLAVLACLLGKVVIEARPLTSYRQHENQVTGMSMTASGRPESDLRAARSDGLLLELARVNLVAERVLLFDQLRALTGPPMQELMRRKRFLEARTLPGGTTGRARRIVEQVRLRTYAEFSSGNRTALMDLLRPAIPRE